MNALPIFQNPKPSRTTSTLAMKSLQNFSQRQTPGQETVPAADRVELSQQALQALHSNSSQKAFPNKVELQKSASDIVDRSFTRVPDSAGEDRHQRNALIQSQQTSPSGGKGLSYYDGSPVVVIAFEGTGSFDERRAPAMQSLGRELQAAGHDSSDPSFVPSHLVNDALKNKRGKDTNWSGLADGVLGEVVKDPKLNANVQWLSFPSEETELLASSDNFKNMGVSDIARDIALSSNGTSMGIELALERVKNISHEAKAQGKSPKFVVMSHSSGGRSSVKFLEQLKSTSNPIDGKPYDIPLVMTIDPVKEAHEALKEGGREFINKGTEHNANRLRSLVGMEPEKVYPPLVRSREQPSALYNTGNAQRWVNFYQTDDIEGLKVGPQVGIQGSPIVGSENIHLNNQGNAGHGAVAGDARLLKRATKELHTLLDSVSPH